MKIELMVARPSLGEYFDNNHKNGLGFTNTANNRRNTKWETHFVCAPGRCRPEGRAGANSDSRRHQCNQMVAVEPR